MNSPPDTDIPTAPQRRFGRFLVKSFGILVLIALAITLSGCFEFDGDATTLRDSLIESSNDSWKEKIELGIGAIPFGMARFVLSFIDLEPEIKALAGSIRGARFGMYEWESNSRNLNRAVMLVSADGAMEARGWQRIVPVLDRRKFVAVYAPDQVKNGSNLKICVAVCDGKEMFLISVKGNVAPLMKIAMERIDEIESEGLDR